MFPPHPFTVTQMGSSSLSTSTLRREERGQCVMRCLHHCGIHRSCGLGMNPSVGPALAADRVDHVSLSQFWLRLKGHRNKTAGFFVELVEITLSSTKQKDDDDASSAQIHYRTSRDDRTRIGGVLARPSDHGLSDAQRTEAARISGRRRLAFHA